MFYFFFVLVFNEERKNMRVTIIFIEHSLRYSSSKILIIEVYVFHNISLEENLNININQQTLGNDE